MIKLLQIQIMILAFSLCPAFGQNISSPALGQVPTASDLRKLYAEKTANLSQKRKDAILQDIDKAGKAFLSSMVNDPYLSEVFQGYLKKIEPAKIYNSTGSVSLGWGLSIGVQEIPWDTDKNNPSATQPASVMHTIYPPGSFEITFFVSQGMSRRNVTKMYPLGVLLPGTGVGYHLVLGTPNPEAEKRVQAFADAAMLQLYTSNGVSADDLKILYPDLFTGSGAPAGLFTGAGTPSGK